jgi:hypothetical protein
MKMATGSIGPEFEFHRLPCPHRPSPAINSKARKNLHFGNLFSPLQLQLKEYYKMRYCLSGHLSQCEYNLLAATPRARFGKTGLVCNFYRGGARGAA